MHNMQLVFVNSQSGFAEVSCMLSWEGGVCILSLVGFRFQTIFLCPREGTFLAMMSYMTENQFMFPICQLPPFSSSENFIIIRRRQETTNVDSSLVLQTLRWVFFSWIFNYEEKFPVFCTILLIDASDGYADDSEEKRIEKRLRTWRRWWWNFKNLLQIVSDKLSSIIVYTSKELLKLKEKCHPLHSSFEFAFFHN